MAEPNSTTVLAKIETSIDWIKWSLGALLVLIAGQYAILFQILLKLAK